MLRGGLYWLPGRISTSSGIVRSVNLWGWWGWWCWCWTIRILGASRYVIGRSAATYSFYGGFRRDHPDFGVSATTTSPRHNVTALPVNRRRRELEDTAQILPKQGLVYRYLCSCRTEIRRQGGCYYYFIRLHWQMLSRGPQTVSPPGETGSLDIVCRWWAL